MASLTANDYLDNVIGTTKVQVRHSFSHCSCIVVIHYVSEGHSVSFPAVDLLKDMLQHL